MLSLIGRKNERRKDANRDRQKIGTSCVKEELEVRLTALFDLLARLQMLICKIGPQRYLCHKQNPALDS